MSAPYWSFRTYFLPVLALAVAAACSDRQAPAGPDDAGLQPGFKGKPGGGDIVVGTFNPTEGAQGESFLMTVSGSGFGKGAKVVFVLNDEDVSTISTTTKSIDETGTNLTADVDIGLDAEDSEDYLVAVTLRGRRGIGAENFKVKVKPNEALGWPIKVTFNDQTPNRLQSDGQPYEYGAVYTEHIDAWIWPGGTEPGYLKMDRRGFGTVSDPVLSTREFELHFDGLGLDLRDGFCDQAICKRTMLISLKGGYDHLNDPDLLGWMRWDFNGEVLANGLLDLPVPPDQDVDPKDPALGGLYSATTRMAATWWGDTGEHWGKASVRFGFDCSSSVPNMVLDSELSPDDWVNRVTVTALYDPRNVGLPTEEAGYCTWVVEGSRARICGFGSKGSKVKGQADRLDIENTEIPFRFVVETLSNQPVPR